MTINEFFKNYIFTTNFLKIVLSFFAYYLGYFVFTDYKELAALIIGFLGYSVTISAGRAMGRAMSKK